VTGAVTETLTTCVQTLPAATQWGLTVGGTAGQGLSILYQFEAAPLDGSYAFGVVSGASYDLEYGGTMGEYVAATGGSMVVGSAVLVLTSVSGGMFHGSLTATLPDSQGSGGAAMVSGTF
jgi:hypothetical protein